MDKPETSMETPRPDEPALSPSVDENGFNGEGASVHPPAKNRFKSFLQSALRWTIGILVVFGLGALAVFLIYYLPVQRNLQNTNVELQQVNQRLSEQEVYITSLESRVEDLEGELSIEQLQVIIMKAELAVIEAETAVEESNFSRASLSLDQAERAVNSLSGMVSERHKPVIADLLKKVNQARGKVDTNLETALPDLATLTVDLAKLREALFSTP